MPKNNFQDQAEVVLKSAFLQREISSEELSDAVSQVILGSHKTYRYILVTNLLARATSDSINPIALQASAPIEGAFDSRSLCHRVVVPFERENLFNALGGSNEPYLNKPARFPTISANNAVRRGNDKRLLDLLVQIFTSIASKEDAFVLLKHAFHSIDDRILKLSRMKNFTSSTSPILTEQYNFIKEILSRSKEGEIPAIVVGAIETIYHETIESGCKVVVHKVNQSGSSSKEIGDIDIFDDEGFLYAIEVKDKDFNQFDFEHAAKKIIDAGGTQGLFIYGENARFDRSSIYNKVAEFENRGYMFVVNNILQYSKDMLFRIGSSDKINLSETIVNVSVEINAKESTKDWILKVIKKFESK